MIAKLSGLLDTVGTDHCIIDCGGVGYLVYCSARTLRRVGDTGAAVSLRTEMQVREDAITLFGFIDLAERDWFRRLTTVQGVGARVALALLSVLEPDKLGQAIAAQDRTALAQADGVGPKLANRLISELKDKVADLRMGGPVTGADGVVVAAGPGATSDAVSALVNLGYRRAEAFTAVAAAAQKAGPDAKVEQLIMMGLKELSA
ncbi:Holliday junction DNA helicase RuvA [Skermanella stibiiresistens SB22]|uniref:Holliday junction branch migration complex subunit RuvA n=1 Tax=Skermanella stibiiresistens SB22 TaxID=1385369 RepID=W9GTH6_9PROT|nr:Holliday junction branch migration protein RuvA [Skermanella stibiiresistens]EWY35727.1 Holliday junction DNA helicase RuvA [Skermanella stibiiresistens SB22]